MNNVDKQYLDILRDVLENGTYKKLEVVVFILCLIKI